MSPADSVTLHITKIENIANQLTDIAESISDVMIMAKILSTLPAKYHAFISAWDSVPAAEQTLDKLRERVLRKEARMNVMDGEDSALATMTVGKEKMKQQSTSSDFNQRKNSITFNFCKKVGHIARYCFAKKRSNYAHRNSKNYNYSKCNAESSTNCNVFVASENSEKFNANNISSRDTDDFFRVIDEKDAWLLDSGASRHTCCRREWFQELTPCQNEYVYLGDETKVNVSGCGTILIKTLVNGKWHAGVIQDVLYVPSLKKNLFSTGVCTSKGLTIVIENDYANIYAKDKTLKAQGIKLKNNLIRMLLSSKVKHEANYASGASIKLWHDRLGHIHRECIQKMLKNNVVSGITLSNEKEFFCESCPFGKQFKLPFKKNIKNVVAPGEIIHTDLCGPMQTTSVGGARYFILFKDEASGFRNVYFLKHKNDTFEVLKKYVNAIKNHFNKEIKFIHSDNGLEYKNKNVTNFLESRGIQLVTSAPHTPEQNGSAEREMRTIVESARTMLITANLSKRLWAEAVNTAVYVLNRTLNTRATDITPFERWFKKKPNLSHLRTFGCDAYALIPDLFRKKWDSKSQKLIFVGYDNQSENYRLFNSKTGRISISRNVIFNENKFSNHDESYIPMFSNTENTERTNHENLQIDEPARSIELDDSIETDAAMLDMDAADDNHRDPRTSDASYNLRPRTGIQPPARYEACTVVYDPPNSYKEALSRDDSALWKRAIDDELEAHAKNKSWDIVELPEGRRPIGFKWVFKIKDLNSKNMHRYKARLCAQGFSQEAGTDYDEIFSPVVRFESVRVLFAIAAK